MPLLRELNPGARTEATNELLRQDNILRSLYLESIRRGVSFFVVLLLVSVALTTFVSVRSVAPREGVAPLTCFFVALTLLGVYYIVQYVLLDRMAWNFGWYRHNFYSDQADVSVLFAPPPKLKWRWVQPALVYAAFAAWIIGAVLVASNLQKVSASPAITGQAVTATITTAHQSKQTSLSVSVPAAPAATQTLATVAVWSRSDLTGMATTIAAFLQAVVLAITFYILWVSSRRQLRTFVGPETFDLLEGNMLNPPQPAHANEPGAVVRIKNFGPTVAYNVRIITRLAVIEPINENTLIQPPLVNAFHSVLGPTVPSTSTAWLGRAVTPGEVDDLKAGVKAIYMYGRVEYRDIFKKERFTVFRLRYAGQFPPPAPAVMTFAAQGNDAN
jgi:hypothetical protein